MTITDARNKLLFYVDSIYQKGFDLGWEAVLEELEIHADELWNNGATKEAEAVRVVIAKIRKGEQIV
jgi:hypothetical protein